MYRGKLEGRDRSIEESGELRRNGEMGGTWKQGTYGLSIGR